ncbi:MAG: right-handed parallel beta-helix repeat-containing protein [Cyclobacteriaceae bacterium]|nr:right-handed parallel beta-helix repeat-containing protein [Cyclobacteriaceae bacterium]
MKKSDFIRPIVLILVVGLFTIHSSFTEARIFYVSPSGDDADPGTVYSPWLTIHKAAITLMAGDTVYIMSGTYSEHVFPLQSGTPALPIVYMACPGHSPVIVGQGKIAGGRVGSGKDDKSQEGQFEIDDKSWIVVSGLKIMHSTSAGIYVRNSSHITLTYNHTYNTFDSGIGVLRSNHIIVDNNDIEQACKGGSTAAQECLTISTTDHFIVSNNHVHHGWMEGIDAKNGSSNGQIFGNHVHNQLRLGIYVDAWDKHTYNIDVFGNLVHDNYANGFAIAAERAGLVENIRVFNNISYHNSGMGITIAGWNGGWDHPMKNIQVVNNTFCNNGWGHRSENAGGIEVANPQAEDVVIRNNICSQNTSFQLVVREGVPEDHLTIDHNLIDGHRGYVGEIYGEDAVVGDAMFIHAFGVNSPMGADFHLQPGSPAVDKGLFDAAPSHDYDGQKRPLGKGPDIGAFEMLK